MASTDPSPDTGHRSYIATFRVAGDYLLYVSAFTQDNPQGPTTNTANYHVVNVADHDHQTFAVPDTNIASIGVGEVAVSVDGYLAWIQVNPGDSGTTETVEADTGSGAITLASVPIANTLTVLPFHELAFGGETLSWLYGAQRQSAQLNTYS